MKKAVTCEPGIQYEKIKNNWALIDEELIPLIISLNEDFNLKTVSCCVGGEKIKKLPHIILEQYLSIDLPEEQLQSLYVIIRNHSINDWEDIRIIRQETELLKGSYLSIEGAVLEGIYNGPETKINVGHCFELDKLIINTRTNVKGIITPYNGIDIMFKGKQKLITNKKPIRIKHLEEKIKFLEKSQQFNTDPKEVRRFIQEYGDPRILFNKGYKFTNISFKEFEKEVITIIKEFDKKVRVSY